MERNIKMIDQLELQKTTLISYLLAKVSAEDWHAVADAAMDLREVEAKLEVLTIQARIEMQKAKAEVKK